MIIALHHVEKCPQLVFAFICGLCYGSHCECESVFCNLTIFFVGQVVNVCF